MHGTILLLPNMPGGVVLSYKAQGQLHFSFTILVVEPRSAPKINNYP